MQKLAESKPEKTKKVKPKKEGLLKKVYYFYSSDLTFKEIEREIFHETRGTYRYYRRYMEKPEKTKESLGDSIIFAKNLFIAFLRKLAPVRRLLYTTSLLLFAISFFYTAELYWLISVSFLILSFLLFLEVADKLTARDELDIARKIQLDLVPRKAPVNENFEIECYSEPAREVGGDYLDFITPGGKEGSLLVSIGDVSGKGMAAALYMLQARAVLRNLVNEDSTPRGVLTALNKNLLGNLKKGQFLSTSLAEINKGKIKFCRAGHMPLLHYSSSSKSFREINPGGIALGLCNGYVFDNAIEEVEIHTEKGDILLFYTDGLSEAMNGRRDEFGLAKVKEIIANNHEKDLKNMQSLILNEVSRFRGNTEVNDDLTLVILKAK